MLTDCIPFRETHYFSEFICNYLEEKEELKPFYNRFPKLENFKAQIEEKQRSVQALITEKQTQSRAILVDSLKKQYASVQTSESTLQHIESLAEHNTFTITTGHQLNLFTGPLYFLYKIISTINLTKELQQAYPDYNFVPIYWMASEDHDFDEINFFNFQGKKVRWNSKQKGAVGQFSTEGLGEVFKTIASEFGHGANAEILKAWFEKAYLNHDNLSDATRDLANAIFGEHGLVILDADDEQLKRLFIPYMEKELLDQTAFKTVSKTNTALEDLGLKIQVNPREINLFYIKDGLRERIVESDGSYQVLNTNINWSKSELIEHLSKMPERFSPNVIMRPLYQEVILPNLCYIGGGGELAYWLQLKSNFEAQEVVFPMLLLRNSVLLISEKQTEKLQKLNVTIEDLFLDQDLLKEKVTRQISELDIDFSDQKKHLSQQFEALYQIANQTDKSFEGAVAAQERKQIKGLEHLEKRLLKAQKRKLSDHLDRITDIQEALFPNQSLQERQKNVSEFYLEYGDNLIPILLNAFKPLQGDFTLITL